MESWYTDFIEQYGYFGIFLVMALENLFPPIPSEVVLPFSGFITTSTDLNIFGVVLASTGGAVFGAIVLYGVGLLLDVENLEKIVDRWGHILRIKKKDIYRADAWFDRYGKWTVFFGRMMPFLRSVISIPAGMANMGFVLFIVFTTLGTLLWNILLISIGAALGENWKDIIQYVSLYSTVIYVGLGLVAVFFIGWYFNRKKRKSQKK
ncbi:DedA family protein [Pseudalkalibacillus sp. SCS-8]|uniref:DedA family protein n=1 Tax=Pseudalkalibacillus nanhaiensis TaxID=3115291 RepID=UPI0032DB5AA9